MFLAESRNCVDRALHPPPVFVRPDHTLCQVAYVFAEQGVTEAAAPAHHPADQPVGVITVPHLLHARRHDLTEEHHRERVPG
ncbi:hypothetical protein ACFYNO_13580 [Kitasatospora sp. NPDC006697]|uniref:hypothetical protein n=1 Tax=Kitasatospora sp. NPDC006697 TaxID=3364020 RepID=UPI00367C0EDA